jgi:hypothetical protein
LTGHDGTRVKCPRVSGRSIAYYRWYTWSAFEIVARGKLKERIKKLIKRKSADLVFLLIET